MAVDPDPGTAALTALFAAPTGAVSEHRNTWPAGSALAGPVTHDDGVVSVDLTAQTVGTAPADPILAVQQLVYTVTGALGTTDPVQVLVAGKQVARLWGDGVDTSLPVARADPLGIRVLVGIDDPADGASVRSPVRIAGEAAVFEATLLWEIRQNGSWSGPAARRPRRASGSRRTRSRSSCRRATTRSASPRTTRPTAPGARS